MLFKEALILKEYYKESSVFTLLRATADYFCLLFCFSYSKLKKAFQGILARDYAGQTRKKPDLQERTADPRRKAGECNSPAEPGDGLTTTTKALLDAKS